MATLSQTRQALATALSTVPGVTVRPYILKTPKTGDGWVTVTRATPDGFQTAAATLVAFVVVGSEEVAAEQKADALLVPLLDAATQQLDAGDVVAESVSVVVGSSSTPLYALTITLTTEVEQ